MFNIGDLVEIRLHDDCHCFPDSPALNMKGTIARITKVIKDKYNPEKPIYNFEVVELHAAKPELIEGDEGRLYWRDSHLIPVKDLDIGEEDVLNVIERE